MNAVAPPQPVQDWSGHNQRWLAERFQHLRARIAGDAGSMAPPAMQATPTRFVPALQRCSELFGLSGFETEVLLLCAGVALDTGLADAVAQAGGRDGLPSFSFAMTLSEAVHWDALSPQAPLRYWQLVRTEGPLPATAPLRIDERVLHYLTGVAAFDTRLDGSAEWLPAPEAGPDLPPWTAEAAASFATGADCVQLQRSGMPVARGDAMALLAALGRNGIWIAELPEDPVALAATLRLVDREAALGQAQVILDLRTRGARLDRVQALLRSPLLVLAASDAPPDPPDLRGRRLSLPPVTPDAQTDDLALRAQRHGSAVPAAELRAALAEASEQFRPGCETALEDAARRIATAPEATAARRLAWQALRAHSRDGLAQLAERIVGSARLEDLVLPDAQAGLLEEIGRQLRHRHQVHRDWGFADRGSRGLGIAALFTGESGTGKTMAAEAIANAAELDLYRIDLAGTVSKYIGETEKNLRRIFDAAEASGAVLLFDEAEALFGKRSDVRDSHDRYANIEVAYLLQRIEAYRGLAILTTNRQSAIDKAFLRRIRFVVRFPFPDASARLALWRRQWPERAPLDGDIDWDVLARLPLAGGHIRAVALNAAFLAAHEGSAIGQRHLLAAAHGELAKLERSPGTSTGGQA